VHLQGVGTILEVVGHADALGGKFFGLAHGDEAGVECVSERGGEDETAGFDAEDGIDLGVLVVGREAVDDFVKSGSVFEEGGDVVEEDAGFGKSGTSRIRDLRLGMGANGYCAMFLLICVHLCLSVA